MDKGNFALISALYSSEGAGLYTDVYMPMIINNLSKELAEIDENKSNNK